MNEQDILDYMTTLSGENFRKLESKIGQKRWVDTYGFPEGMYKWFIGGISKHRGDDWEKEYIASCASLGLKTSGDHDAVLDQSIVQKNNLKGKLIEIKFFSALVPDGSKKIEKRGWALPWGERAQRIKTDTNNVTGYAQPKNGTWLQVKPACANYGLFSVLHGNGAMHYWIPYHLISQAPGKKNYEQNKIPLGIQHRNHTTEGQVGMTPRIHELFFLDVTIDTPFLTDLSKYDLSKYENLTY